MAREVIVYDRQGNAFRVSPVQYPPPAIRQEYPVPSPYYDEERPQPIRRKKRKKVSRPLTSMFLLFVVGWIPCALGFPGGTWLVWGIGFTILMLKHMKED